MERASIAHAALAQPEGLSVDAPAAIAQALREIAEAGALDTEQALALACERLAQSIAAAERLRGELRARRGELRELENRMQITSEMLCEGILVFDPHGRVVYANNGAGRILHMSHDQLLSRHARDRRWRLLHEDGSPWPLATHPIAETLQTGRSRRAVTVGVLGHGGAVTWILLSSAPRSTARGAPAG